MGTLSGTISLLIDYINFSCCFDILFRHFANLPAGICRLDIKVLISIHFIVSSGERTGILNTDSSVTWEMQQADITTKFAKKTGKQETGVFTITFMIKQCFNRVFLEFFLSGGINVISVRNRLHETDRF